ncbi:MAG: hypothetical protein CMQ34_06165 [Gammaproteobacteria bacterium]|nr:hypothetical protein [Gammaproteobacteria bacterium]|tara:strand:- start:1602 stop:3491 length:1890 start_codon:yes stop_codon:yes gene_type:complete
MTDRQPENRRPIRTGLYALAGALLVLGVIRYYPLAAMNLSGLLVVVVVLSWLAYQYLARINLMRRHALLSHVTQEGSRLRRLFWDSLWQRLLLLIAALTSALIALTMTSALTDLEWVVIIGSLPLFLLFYGLSHRLFAAELTPRYRLPVLLRISHRCTLAVSAVVLVWLQFYLADVPDTRHLDLSLVLQAGYQRQAAQTALAPVGVLLGSNAALSDGMWHLMQLASDSDALLTPVKLGVWLIFLLVNALKLGALWVLLLGMVTLVTGLQSGNQSPLGASPFSRHFSMAMIVLLIVYLLLTQVNIGSYFAPTRGVDTAPTMAPLAGPLDPCANVSSEQQQQQQQALADQAQRALSAQQQAMIGRLNNDIDALVGQAFAPASVGVERFLDWNFSLRGQYTQLAFMGRTAIAESTFADYIGGQIDHYVGSTVVTGLTDINETLAGRFDSEVRQVYQLQDALMSRLLASANCLSLPQPTLALDDYMNKSLVGAGSGAGVLAARASMRMGSRVVSRTATRRVISGGFARLTGRLATSAAAGSTGALCGPLVFICAPALAAATWVGTDLLINEVDESLNRAQMRADMMAVLAEDEAAMRVALKDAYARAAQQMFADIETYQQRRFNINRDAFPPP